MEIEYKSKLDVRFCVGPNKGSNDRWQLLAPFVFSVDGVEFEVPVAFWTDFASVPRCVWPIISPYELGHGPIPHDFGYFTGIRSQKFWDDVFMTCMKKDNISIFKRNAAYCAVRMFGGFVFRDYRRKNLSHNLVQASATKRFKITNWQRKTGTA
jgi:hypothetical protein